jgi:tetratricopeptide (TPR) repeat protein
MTKTGTGRAPAVPSILAFVFLSGILALGVRELAAMRRQALAVSEALLRIEELAAFEAAASKDSTRLFTRKLDEIARMVAAPTDDLPARAGAEAGPLRDESIAACDLPARRSFEAGLEAFSAGRYERAADLFGETARNQPEDVDACRYEAASRFLANPADSSNYSRAQALLRKALTVDPGDALALKVLARISLESGEWADAVDYFERLGAAGKADAEDKAASACAASWAKGAAP